MAIPFIPLHPDDYLKDTQHLTTEEHGAYLLLILNYWQKQRALDNSGDRLRHVVKLTPKKWEKIKPVLSEFFQVEGDFWMHSRIESDLKKVLEKSLKASRAGMESARKRGGQSVDNSSEIANAVVYDVQKDVENSEIRKKTKNFSKVLKNANPKLLTNSDQSAQNERETASERSTNVQQTFNHRDRDRDRDADKDKRHVQISFGQFWEIYPRRDGKKRAEQSYERALKRASAEDILAGLKKYISGPIAAGQIAAMASTWLNGDRWADDVSTVFVRGFKPTFGGVVPLTTPRVAPSHTQVPVPGCYGETMCASCGQSWPCSASQEAPF